MLGFVHTEYNVLIIQNLSFLNRSINMIMDHSLKENPMGSLSMKNFISFSLSITGAIIKWYFIIIIVSRHQHGYPWPSLATPPYHSLLRLDLLDYIPYQHGAVVCRFGLVFLLLLVHVKGYTGVHHLWAHPYFSSSVSHVWFIQLG